MVLVKYEINENRLKVRVKVDWMVFHFDCKYTHQRLLATRNQWLWALLFCLYFQEEERD